jgi:hypothetical protein
MSCTPSASDVPARIAASAPAVEALLAWRMPSRTCSVLCRITSLDARAIASGVPLAASGVAVAKLRFAHRTLRVALVLESNALPVLTLHELAICLVNGGIFQSAAEAGEPSPYRADTNRS